MGNTSTVTPVTGSAATRRKWAPRLALAGITVMALVVRWQLVDVESGDYRAFLEPWYAHLARSGGFAGLADDFSNYNTPYLALLALLTYLPVRPLLAVKTLSVIFDLVLASFAFMIVRELRPVARWQPAIAYGAVLLLPTVVMNSSAWAQCDSIYAAFCAASLYFLLKRRPWVASVMFGLAFAFKLQAVFFLPVLVAVLVINRPSGTVPRSLRSLVGVPAAFLAALLPALAAGRSLLSQLAVYPAQVTGSSGAGGLGGLGGVGAARPGGGFRGGRPELGSAGGPRGGQGPGGLDAHSFTYNAPTPYAWLPSDASTTWKYAGLALAAAVALTFAVWLIARRRRLSSGEVMLLAATATLVVPLLLPEMHERYFYVAEVLAVLAAFADRRFLAVAGLIELASISTYLSYLASVEVLPLEVASAVALAAAATAGLVLVRRLEAGDLRAVDQPDAGRGSREPQAT